MDGGGGGGKQQQLAFLHFKLKKENKNHPIYGDIALI
jgi:hypothetical protein